MKKLLLITMITGTIYAQSNVMLYGGFNSMGESDYTTDLERKAGFSLGIAFPKSESLTYGLGYTTKGYKDSYYYEGYYGYFEVDEDVKINAIEGWVTNTLTPNNPVSLFIGASVAYLMKADADVTVNNVSESGSVDLDEFEISIMGGIDTKLGESLELSVGYQMALNNVDDDYKFNNLFVRIGIPLSN